MRDPLCLRSTKSILQSTPLSLYIELNTSKLLTAVRGWHNPERWGSPTPPPPAGLQLNGALWGEGHLSDIFCDEDFCKHFRGSTSNKWHVCEHDEPVNIYPQPKVAGDIVLGFCNSSPESTILTKRQGVKSVCTRLILCWHVTVLTEPIILQ